MVFLGELVGFADDLEVVVRTVLLDPLHEVAEPRYREDVGRDLLAQSRHKGL